MPRTPPGQTRDRIYRFVRDRLLGGDAPSLREIRDHFGFRAVETVRAHLAVLVAEGRLDRQPGKARGYRLPAGAVPRQGLAPIVGTVAAGGFEEAIGNPEGEIPIGIPPSRSASDYFALRVRGESMTGAGIFPGDTVVIDRRARPRSGQIVVALVEGEVLETEATVKRLVLTADAVELHPENPAYPVLRPAADSCRILGPVVELRRRFR